MKLTTNVMRRNFLLKKSLVKGILIKKKIRKQIEAMKFNKLKTDDTKPK